MEQKSVIRTNKQPETGREGGREEDREIEGAREKIEKSIKCGTKKIAAEINKREIFPLPANGNNERA